MSAPALSRAIRGAVGAYRSGWGDGSLPPWQDRDRLPEAVENSLEALAMHGLPDCPCAGCQATGAYNTAAEAASAGDEAQAQTLQRVGDAWFVLAEAARGAGLDGAAGRVLERGTEAEQEAER